VVAVIDQAKPTSINKIGIRHSTLGKFKSTIHYLARTIARGGSNREGDFVFTALALLDLAVPRTLDHRGPVKI
jgi:hypothetical protein